MKVGQIGSGAADMAKRARRQSKKGKTAKPSPHNTGLAEVRLSVPDGRTWVITEVDEMTMQELFASETDKTDKLVSDVLDIEARSGIRLRDGQNALEFWWKYRAFCKRREKDGSGVSFVDYMQHSHPNIIDSGRRGKRVAKPRRDVLWEQLKECGNPGAVWRRYYKGKCVRATVYNWCNGYGFDCSEPREADMDRKHRRSRESPPGDFGVSN